MKKVVKYLGILITLSLFNLNVVYGASNCGNVTFKASGKGSPSGSSYGGYQVYNYGVTVNGSWKEAICHNPGIHAWDNGGETLQCQRMLFDPTSTDSSKQNIYDAGIVYILKNGGSTFQKWQATNLYQLFFPNYVDVRYVQASKASGQLYYFEKQVNNYLTGSNTLSKSIQEKVKELRKYMGNTVGTQYKNVGGYNDTTNISNAMNVVDKALGAALDYAKNGAATIKVSKSPVQKKENTETELKSTFTYQINISKFHENSSASLDYNCASGCSNITAVRFFLNDEEISLTDLRNTNLITKYGTLNENNRIYDGNVNLKIEFTGPLRADCGNVTYNLVLNYRDISLAGNAYEVAECSSVGRCQRLYVLDDNGSSSSGMLKQTTYSNTFSMCPNSSGGLNSCKTYMSDVECKKCKTDGKTIEIKEGYDTQDNCKLPTEDELNIKKCVANNRGADSAGNSFKNNNLTAEAGSNNFVNGGGIYCKEDYKMELPGTKNVEAGRYFTLNAKVYGTETCYSSEIVSGSSVNAQIKSDAANTVSVYQQYASASALVACIEGEEDYETCSRLLSYRMAGYCESRYEQAKRYADKIATTVEKGVDAHGQKVVETTYSCPTGYVSSSDTQCVQYYQREIKRWQGIPYLDIYYDYTYYTTSCSPVTTRGHYHWDAESSGRTDLYGCFDFNDDDEAKFDDTEYANRVKPTVLAAIGTAAAFTCHGSGDASKGDTTYSCSGSGSTGFQSGLGTGGMYSIAQSHNKVIGFYTGDQIIGGGSVTDGNTLDLTFGTGTGTGTKNFGVGINPVTFGGWVMSYNFKPNLHFWYEEAYMDKFKSNELERTVETLQTNPTEYCMGDVSDDYKTCYGSGGWQKELNSSNGGVIIDSACACTTAGCKMYSYVVANARYMKKSQTASASYVSPTQFYTIFPHGGVALAEETKDIENSQELTHGLPVGLGTTTGQHTYMLWFDDLGEYFNSGDLGRIWGDGNSIVPKTLKESSACRSENSALIYDKTIGDKYLSGGYYACIYDVNPCCGPCLTTIIERGYKCVSFEDEDGVMHYYDDHGEDKGEANYNIRCCPSGNCYPTCTPCLFNGDLAVDYRQVSTENLNPNDRTLGRNWNWDNQISTGLELKAYVATQEIEEAGDTVFDINFDNPTSSNDFAMKVEMDATTMGWIRAYNRDKADGYLSNTMECYDLKSGENTYENVYCYSTFIDELLENVGDKVTIAGPTRPSTENERKAYSNRYFKNWIDADISKWNVTTEEGIEISSLKTQFGFEYNEETGDLIDHYIGPSWK